MASIKGVDDDKIPDPWRRGDVVVSTIDFDGGHGDVLSVGDVGMIIGPSTGSKALSYSGYGDKSTACFLSVFDL